MFFPDHIEDIVDTLRIGGVIIYPTDTVWGLGCDPFNQAAVQRIYEIKKRDADKPLILLVNSISMLKKYVLSLHPRVETLLVYHKKPLTLIHQKVINLPDYLLAKDGSIAIRIVQDRFCKTLINAFGFPLTSSSVNRSNEPAPRYFGEINSHILRQVEYVVKYSQHEKKIRNASVIARYNQKGELIFIRE